MASPQTYPVTEVPQENTDSVVKRFRLIAHKYGALTPEMNYWTIDLVCDDKPTVRLHMKLEGAGSASNKGQLTVTIHLPSASLVPFEGYWDFEAKKDLNVYFVLQLILDNRRQGYNMPISRDYRHWV